MRWKKEAAGGTDLIGPRYHGQITISEHVYRAWYSRTSNVTSHIVSCGSDQTMSPPPSHADAVRGKLRGTVATTPIYTPLP